MEAAAGVAAVETTDLRRTYETQQGLWGARKKSHEALRGVSLSIQQGELFGLLGPNGAGKTTLVKILSTVLLPTSGQAKVLGHDVVRDTTQVRNLIGVVFGGERGLYTRLTARQTLHYWAALYKMSNEHTKERVPYLLELVGLGDRAEERVEGYSRGMKQRLHLARGLLHNPQVLFLDEPTIGLDPVASVSFREVIKELQRSGMTVLLTTHYMQEAESLCDRVAFINEGQIVLLDSPRALSRAAAQHVEIEAVVPQSTLALLDSSLRQHPALHNLEVTASGAGSMVHIKLDDSAAYPATLALLAEAGATQVVTREPTLESIYLGLLGERKMKV
ncbi:MAG TPA: ABC transporter ATP-binding protein [Chloroflexia bacterium]|nr:ABC transporter ATP-binding protein [Chloroflexia bacterium]